MKRAPNVWHLLHLVDHCEHGPRCEVEPGCWVPARPLGLDTLAERFWAAWLVFSGRGDVVLWPGQR